MRDSEGNGCPTTPTSRGAGPCAGFLMCKKGVVLTVSTTSLGPHRTKGAGNCKLSTLSWAQEILPPSSVTGLASVSLSDQPPWLMGLWGSWLEENPMQQALCPEGDVISASRMRAKVAATPSCHSLLEGSSWRRRLCSTLSKRICVPEVSTKAKRQENARGNAAWATVNKGVAGEKGSGQR